MSGAGSGYDLSVSMFSPDGKIFQVDYAKKCVSSSSLGIGLVCNDGVILASENWISTTLSIPGCNTYVFQIAKHVCAVVVGSRPDGAKIVQRAREEAANYESVWRVPIPGSVLADRLGLYLHHHTAVWSTRPFGCSLILAVADKYEGFKNLGSVEIDEVTRNFETSATKEFLEESSYKNYSLWLIDPSGSAFKYRGVAQGKSEGGAKTELEKLPLDDLTVEEAKNIVSRIIYNQHMETNPDKKIRLEMITINANNVVQRVDYKTTESLLEQAKITYEQQL